MAPVTDADEESDTESETEWTVVSQTVLLQA